MSIKDKLDELITSLPEEARPVAEDAADLLMRQTEDWLGQFVELLRSRQKAKAYKMLLKAMTPEEIVSAQKDRNPFIVQIALANLAEKEARDAIVEQAWEVLKLFLIAAVKG